MVVSAYDVWVEGRNLGFIEHKFLCIGVDRSHAGVFRRHQRRRKAREHSGKSSEQAHFGVCLDTKSTPTDIY